MCQKCDNDLRNPLNAQKKVGASAGVKLRRHHPGNIFCFLHVRYARLHVDKQNEQIFRLKKHVTICLTPGKCSKRSSSCSCGMDAALGHLLKMLRRVCHALRPHTSVRSILLKLAGTAEHVGVTILHAILMVLSIPLHFLQFFIAVGT